MKDIFKELQRCKDENINGVLGTIITTQGSTYQKAGAKCFIAEDGKLTGLVSGGCVEGDLAEIAKGAMESGNPKVVHYNFMGEGDFLWGLGLGCNGKMNIFLEPYCPKTKPKQAAQLAAWFKQGMNTPVASVIVTDAESTRLIGKRWIIDTESALCSETPLKEITKTYLEEKTLPIHKAVRLDNGETMDVFFEESQPTPNIAIFGAGPDVVPLLKMAKLVKWKVSILDHRPSFLTEENFPEADELILCIPGQIPEFVIRPHTYVVLMSHHFSQDQMMLKAALKSNAPYIGLLGPKKRTTELCNGLDLNLFGDLTRIHSPIGLDIGSQSPEEVALSIMAEIIASYRGGSGTRLSTTDEGLSISSYGPTISL